MAENNNMTEENKKVDEDCDVKDGVAVERYSLKHPIKSAKLFKERHPKVCAGMTLAAIAAMLVYVYTKGRHDADAAIFDPSTAEDMIPNADPELIEQDPSITEVPEVEETAPEMVETK